LGNCLKSKILRRILRDWSKRCENC
jgi:hypothetical protein